MGIRFLMASQIGPIDVPLLVIQSALRDLIWEITEEFYNNPHENKIFGRKFWIYFLYIFVCLFPIRNKRKLGKVFIGIKVVRISRITSKSSCNR